MCTVCDSTHINTIIQFVPHVSGDGFNGGYESYLQFRDTHAPCLLKLCIRPSNGTARWWLFPEFGAKLSPDNCTPTINLNNPVQFYTFPPKFPSRSVGSVRIFFSAPPLPCCLPLCSSLWWKPICSFIQSNEQNLGLCMFCIELLLRAGRTDFEVQAVQVGGGIGVWFRH